MIEVICFFQDVIFSFIEFIFEIVVLNELAEAVLIALDLIRLKRPVNGCLSVKGVRGHAPAIDLERSLVIVMASAPTQ